MQRNKRIVAVLMSSYNGTEFIKEQIDSIVNQKGSFSLDLIIRDDGSTDDTIQIISSYKQAKSILGENIGPARSFLSILLECEEYDYYAFADQDDVWKEDKLEKAISAISKIKKPALYCSNAEVVDKNLKPVGRNVYKTKPPTDFKTVSCCGGLLGCSMVFNNELAKIIKTTKHLPSNIIMHDFYFAEICLAVGGSVIYDDTPSLLYRQHGNNSVGVSYDFLKKIHEMFSVPLTKETISISDQATEILKNYNNYISVENREWLATISKYKKTIISKVKLGLSKETHYPRFSSAFKNRLSIILGNK